MTDSTTLARDTWFHLVDTLCGRRWGRRDERTLYAWFPGYKPYEYSVAQERLAAVGSFVLSVDWDAQAGSTFVTFREPKSLEPAPDDEFNETEGPQRG